MTTTEINPDTVAAERQRQIEKGYTEQHDYELGVDLLLVFALERLEKCENLKAAAIIQAARAVYDRKETYWTRLLYMNSMQTDIENFMTACDQEVNKYPKLPSDSVRNLRIKLMVEELLGSTNPTGQLVESKSDELIQSMLNNDLVGIADGIADVLYVVIGTAAAYGINIQEVFDEVHRSNMTKTVWDPETGKHSVIKNEFGKVMKPETYVAPDVEKVIERLIDKALGGPAKATHAPTL